MKGIYAPSSPDERVAVVAYDLEWPARSQEDIARLRTALGHRVREIEHFASTAVPGLAAKPIIDLQDGVIKPVSVPSLTPILAAAGYEDLGEAGVPGRQYFRRRQPPVAANLHIVWNRKLWRQNLTLRDYLRAYPEEADYYGRQKREVMAQHGRRSFPEGQADLRTLGLGRIRGSGRQRNVKQACTLYGA